MTPRTPIFWLLAFLAVYALLAFTGIIDTWPTGWQTVINLAASLALIIGIYVTIRDWNK